MDSGKKRTVTNDNRVRRLIVEQKCSTYTQLFVYLGFERSAMVNIRDEQREMYHEVCMYNIAKMA